MPATTLSRQKLSRPARLARKYKSVLRCEWCNRWTEVPMKKWWKLYKAEALFPAEYMYFCPRPQCKRERNDCLDPS